MTTVTQGPADVYVVTTTCANEEEATNLARALLDAKLAACVQIMPVRSLYRWKGQIHDEPEALLIVKLRKQDWPALETEIRARHSYETPEILAFEAAAGHPPYLRWIADAAMPKVE